MITTATASSQVQIQRERPALFEYALVSSYPSGTPFTPGVTPAAPRNFDNTLNTLRDLAMSENWDYSTPSPDRHLPILYNYLLHTFARIKEEGKLIEIENYSCFNTGLVTENQEEIFMLFKKKRDGNGWIFQEFCKDSSSSLQKFKTLPERAMYFAEHSELIYDTRLELRINIDHIVDDAENFARFPKDMQQWSKHQLINTFKGAIDHAKKRVKRNYLTAIPQYYRGKYTAAAHLQLLLPLCLRDASKADLALAVYKKDGMYNGRTCLTLD